MLNPKLFLHFYKRIFSILLLLCLICFWFKIYPIPFLIAFIPIGLDYFYRYTFKKEYFYLYLNKGFSVRNLYLYSFLLNAFTILSINIFLYGASFY